MPWALLSFATLATSAISHFIGHHWNTRVVFCYIWEADIRIGSYVNYFMVHYPATPSQKYLIGLQGPKTLWPSMDTGGR